MTTLTQETIVAETINEAQAAVQVAEEKLEAVEAAVVGRAWEGQYARLDLDAIQQNIASDLSDKGKRTDSGVKFDRKTFYEVAENQGIAKRTIEAVEQFQENYATAVHAVSSDLSLKGFKDNPELAEYGVKAEMGKHTNYEDTYRRFDSRSVSGGAGGERRLQETYGYHNPTIKTKIKGFENRRQAVHALAKDLLG